MADTKISALTDGVTANSTDRVAVARSPFGATDNRYITPGYLQTLFTPVFAAASHTHAQSEVTGLTTADSPQFAGLNLGHASDTTLTRTGAGDIAVEGNAIYRVGGADVALADGGLGVSLTDPNADRLLFWDDSAGIMDWLVPGTGLSISGTTLNASGGGVIVDRAYAEYTTYTDLTVAIPQDDTIPQNTEGTEILTATITPKSTTNRVRVRFQGMISTSASDIGCAALFQDSIANALAAVGNNITGNNLEHVALEFEHVPGTTSAITYKIRAGSSSTVNTRFNGHSARRYGGTARATLLIEEIQA
jgi:hypothetical protein